MNSGAKADRTIKKWMLGMAVIKNFCYKFRLEEIACNMLKEKAERIRNVRKYYLVAIILQMVRPYDWQK